MCWNAEVSLKTFLVSILSILTLYYVGYDQFIIAFLLSFVLMQLIEYFIWIYIKHPNILRILAILSFIIIFLQPIIVMYYAKYAQYIKYYLASQLIILLICIIFFNLRLSSFVMLPYVSTNNHLAWNWIKNNNVYLWMFYIIYNIFFLGTLWMKQYYLFFAFAVVTLVYSTYNYYKYNTASSMWCWIANFIIIIALIDALRKYASIY